ncbi:MAG TPA: IclR family transcriptional regulator [Ktedonobacterales bacterium]|nr:IclR family transcriptional regulator [Ktedonobacterales bacterium]
MAQTRTPATSRPESHSDEVRNTRDDQAPQDERDGALRGVDRALGVLLAFSRETPTLGVTELSERLGLTKSAIHRILRSLMAHGMVTQDRETRAYSLGFRALALASAVPGEASLRQICLPHMQWLRTTTDETIGLYVVAGDVRMCLEELESPQLLRMAAGVGRCFPLDSGAASKALLVAGPANAELWRRATGRLSAERRAALLVELERLRSVGFVVTRGETVAGSASMAAPIRMGARDEVMAALSIAGPASRFGDVEVSRYAPLLREAVERIARDLGALYGAAPDSGARAAAGRP